MDNKRQHNAIEEVREHINVWVDEGFDDLDRLIQNALDVFCDDYDPAWLRKCARRLATEALTRHAEDQKTWPAVTDCDRLDMAFAELESEGIISRQDFSCCANCGTGEIACEITAAREAGREVLGYTFYHMQDTESAARGHGLYLHFGSVLRGEKAAVDVGRKIADVLKRHELKVIWDGSWSNCIKVEMDWKRRRPARA